VFAGQPWKARARLSMHCTSGGRGSSALSDLRTLASALSCEPPWLKIVEGCQLFALWRKRE